MKRLAAIVILSASTYGCAASSSHLQKDYCLSGSSSELLGATDLKSMFKGIADEICKNPCPKCMDSAVENDHDKTVLVTDFVELQSFVPGPTGILMGELMRSSLAGSCCYKVVQGEFSKYFRLSDKGMVALTRQASDIKNHEYPYQEVVVGTYDATGDKIILFVRKIDSKSGKIVRMITREITYSCSGGSIVYTVF